MKSESSFLILIFFVLGSFAAYCQTDITNYKYSRITLSTGELVKAKNISIEKDKVSFTGKNSSSEQKMIITYDIMKVENIKVAAKTNILPGFLIGTGVGVISTFVARNIIEKPETEYISGVGTVDVNKTMTIQGKLTIIAGGSLIGTLIGASIKKGWKTVYPKSLSIFDKFDFNIFLNTELVNASGLILTYKF